MALARTGRLCSVATLSCVTGTSIAKKVTELEDELYVTCRSHLAQAHIHQAGATAASALGRAVAGVPVYTWCFCGMIVLSRVAFWVYDMVDCQIFQSVSTPCQRCRSCACCQPAYLCTLVVLHFFSLILTPGFHGSNHSDCCVLFALVGMHVLRKTA